MYFDQEKFALFNAQEKKLILMMNTTHLQCRRDIENNADLEPEHLFMLRTETIMKTIKFTTAPCKGFRGSARKHHGQI